MLFCVHMVIRLRYLMDLWSSIGTGLATRDDLGSPSPIAPSRGLLGTQGDESTAPYRKHSKWSCVSIAHNETSQSYYASYEVQGQITDTPMGRTACIHRERLSLNPVNQFEVDLWPMPAMASYKEVR
jgi:hypothetical protein